MIVHKDGRLVTYPTPNTVIIMLNSFSPKDSFGKSQTLSMSGLDKTPSKNGSGFIVTTSNVEEVLTKLVGVCLLGSLVASKVDYGDELVKRLPETKVK